MMRYALPLFPLFWLACASPKTTPTAAAVAPPPRPPSSAAAYPTQFGQILVKSLRVRRPVGRAADPHAGPGGVDYRSETPVNAQLDCESATDLFKGISLTELSKCVDSVKKVQKVRYRLRRRPEPFLELVDPEDAPDCLRELLPKIPVPREIFYQVLENPATYYSCYSTGLDIEADEVTGVKIPWNRVALELQLPLFTPGISDEQMRMDLLTWATAPMWRSGKLHGVYVPESLCKVCLGEENLVRPGDAPPLLWPQ